jgi:transcriptional regulator with XRE-family HTH domain
MYRTFGEWLMASGLGAFLRAEIKKRNWTDRQFADFVGIPPSNLSNLLNKTTQKPNLETLDRLSVALNVDLDDLIVLCGYTLRRNPDKSRDERVAILIEKVPEIRGFVESLSQLRPEDLDRAQSYVDGVLGKGQVAQGDAK